MSRIVVSFKNTEADIDLYNKIAKSSGMSAYVKDCLRNYFKLIGEEIEPSPIKPNMNVKEKPQSPKKDEPKYNPQVQQVQQVQEVEKEDKPKETQQVEVIESKEETEQVKPKIQPIKNVGIDRMMNYNY